MADQPELSVQDFFAFGNNAAAETAALRARFGAAATGDDEEAMPDEAEPAPR